MFKYKLSYNKYMKESYKIIYTNSWRTTKPEDKYTYPVVSLKDVKRLTDIKDAQINSLIQQVKSLLEELRYIMNKR